MSASNLKVVQNCVLREHSKNWLQSEYMKVVKKWIGLDFYSHSTKCFLQGERLVTKD